MLGVMLTQAEGLGLAAQRAARGSLGQGLEDGVHLFRHSCQGKFKLVLGGQREEGQGRPGLCSSPAGAFRKGSWEVTWEGAISEEVTGEVTGRSGRAGGGKAGKAGCAGLPGAGWP